MLFESQAFYWADTESWSLANATRDKSSWIAAKKFSWRDASNWMGAELRYGSDDWTT